MKRTKPIFTLMIAAAPSPWTMRAAISRGRLGATAQASEAATKTARPGR